MGNLIIIRGPLGVGNTTISKILAERLGAKYISIDKLLEDARLDRIDPKLGCIPAANFVDVQDEAMTDIKKFLERQDVVVDGNFYHKEQIEFFRKNFKYDLHFVTLKAKLETCINRDRKREKSFGKTAVEVVYSLVKEFDTGFVVDVEGKTREQVVEQIQRGLGI
jgi:broad-specificity NMP kinase